MFRRATFDPERLRLGFVAYGGMSSDDDWRSLTPEHLDTSEDDVARELLPMLRKDVAPPRHELAAWTQQLVTRCRDLARALLPLRPSEAEFIAHLNDDGELRPELLTDDSPMCERLARHPALLWKCQKVKSRRRAPATQ